MPGYSTTVDRGKRASSSLSVATPLRYHAAMDRRTRQRLVERLNRDAGRVARRFALRYRSIEAERGNVTSRYGHCTLDGVIKIRLRHAVTGQALKYSSLVNTLCHELAHLRHFDHGERFKAFYLELLAFAPLHRRSAAESCPGKDRK